LDILENDDYYVRQSLSPTNDAFQRMQMTKWLTIAGVTLAVVSSSLLYINLMAYFVWFDYVNATVWLNPLIVYGNVDSILNDLGMLMVSTFATATTSRSTRGSSLKDGGESYNRESGQQSRQSSARSLNQTQDGADLAHSRA
jgi:hypothetical protein